MNNKLVICKSLITGAVVLMATGFSLSAIAQETPPQQQSTEPTQLADPSPVDVSRDVEISADELEANLPKDIVVFVGNVEVRQKELTLNADRVTVFYQSGENVNSAITRIDASGSVLLATGSETIQSTWGIYDFAEKIVTLGGKVVLKRPDGEIKGKRLVYNLETGRISVEGSETDKDRVKGQFTLPDE